MRYRYTQIRVWMSTASALACDVVARLARAADIGVDTARGRLLAPQLQENTVTTLELP